ncbi:hypothetical protein BFG52_02625 [Acinetobacter larvae]|uniref:HTH luxR-type domain-containing protein n=2 Tax=Acinetobacter larvae TaxID=1789224 RepID=A0A1B2LWN7_9GAMM|nr:hypothetical protein BFG52_02625 [Acinetobacter larvae]
MIQRQALLKRLDPTRHVAIRLLYGPAGFGKTVLAKQFAEQYERPVIWLTLPTVPHLTATALQTYLCQALGASSDDEQSLEQCYAKHQDCLMVLDHYQSSPACDIWLFQTIQRSPLQWLLTSRDRPEWSFSRLLLEGKFNSLNSQDLALTETEISEILVKFAPTQHLCAQHLYEQSQGWAAVLRLFLYAQNQREAHNHIQLYQCPYVLDYLDHEVLHVMPQKELHLLQVIAHAPFVDHMICHFLSGQSDLLRDLSIQKNLLRIQPGSTDRYTLYEPLRALFKIRYPQQQQKLWPVLNWLERNQRYLSTFAYAVAVAAYTRAVQALAQVAVQKLWVKNNLAVILSGLEYLSPDDFTAHPQALLLATRALIMGGKLDAADRYLAVLEQYDVTGAALALHAEFALHRGQAQNACNLAVQALVYFDQNQDWVQMVLCFSCLTRAELALGHYAQALNQQRQGLELARRKNEILLSCQLMLDQAQVEELAGNLHQAIQLLDRIKILISQHGGSVMLCGAEQIRRGWLLMLIGDDAAAREALQQGYQLSVLSGSPIFFYSAVLLAQLDARIGQIHQAQQRLMDIEQVMYRQNIAESIYRRILHLGRASIELLSHQYQPAVQRLERMHGQCHDFNLLTPPSSCPEFFELLQLVHAQALCSQGELDQAIGLLTHVLEKAQGSGFQIIVSQALMALAKARHERGDGHQAERLLASATAMAVRQGQGQLTTLQSAQSAIGTTTATVTSYFTQSSRAQSSLEPMESVLSPREHVVLELIAKGYSNAEIAEILSISLHTVKAHAKKINAKFQVNRRTLAVARAKTLGLLA